jgi:hypothetical protein
MGCVQANTYLLATCYFRAGQPFRACRVLRGANSPASRYLLALTCMQLPDKLAEAEHALDPQRDGKDVRVLLDPKEKWRTT